MGRHLSFPPNFERAKHYRWTLQSLELKETKQYDEEIENT